MKTRQLIAVGTALAAATAGPLIAAPAEAAPPGAPTHVRTTVTLTPRFHYRVTIVGQARAGATVVLQDRYEEHDNWVTQSRTTAKRGGTFRATYITPSNTTGSYRVCVVRPSGLACTPGGQKHLVKAKGKISLTYTAPQVVPYETTLIAQGKVSRIFRDYPTLKAQYLNPVQRHWADIPGVTVTMVDNARFRVEAGTQFAGATSQQGQLFRILAMGTPNVRTAAQSWRANSYAQQSLINLPVVTGSRIQGQVTYGFVLNSPVTSAAVSPSNTVTLAVPQGCGRVQAGISQDLSIAGLGPYSATVARNGITAWSYDSLAPGPKTFSLDVSGGDTVSLTVTFDPAHPEWRPWFVSPYQPMMTAEKHPFALCSAP